MKIELTKEQFELLNGLGTIISLADGTEYYNLPQWFKRKGESMVFDALSEEEIPPELRPEIMIQREKTDMAIARETIENYCSYDVENEELVDVLNRQGINGLSHVDIIINDGVTIFVTDSFTEESKEMVKKICYDFCVYWFFIDRQEGVEQIFTNPFL